MASTKRITAGVLFFGICRSFSAEVSAECTWPIDVSLYGTLDSGEEHLTRFAFRERAEPELVMVTETSDINISNVQNSFASQVEASASWRELMARRSCSLGIDNPSFALLPSPPRAIGRIRVTARKYTCVLRTKTRVASANITSTIPLSLDHTGDQLRVTTGQVVTETDTSWEQRAVFDLIGASLGGIGGAVLTDYFQKELLKSIRGRVNAGFGAPPTTLMASSSVPAVPGYNPQVTDTSFIDLGGGKLGIRIVRIQNKIRKGTACFLADALKRKAAQSADRGNPISMVSKHSP